MLQFNAIKDYCIFKDFFLVYRCALPQSGYWQSHQVGFIFIITSRWSREWEGREYLEERTTVNYD